MSTNMNLGLCDMVLALSESTINGQFAGLHQKDIIHQTWNIVIFQDSDGNVSQVKTNQSEVDFQKDIKENLFAYAFNTVINSPKISVIKDERKTLIFLIPFNTGTLYCWTGHGNASTLKEVDMKGWVYAFNTDIGSIHADTSGVNWLTTESQQQCVNVCSQNGLSQSDFTVESLFLDFENVNYSTYVQSKSKITSDMVTVKIFQNLLSNYFKTLAKTNNPYILAYGLKIKNSANQPLSLFQPTSLDFSTSYNSNVGLNALNFLMMIGGNSFPIDQNAGVLPTSLITTVDGGKLEIDRGAFSGVLSKIISPSLDQLSIIPSSSINANSVGVTFKVSFAPDRANQQYTYVNDGSSKILSYNYSKSSHDSDTSPTFFPPFAIWGNITTTISISSDVYLEGNTIRVCTSTTCFMYLNTEGGVSKGNLTAYTSETKYTLGVGDNNKITLTAGKPVFKDNSNFNTSAWSQFLSLGQIDGMIDSLKGFWSVMKNFIVGQQNYIEMVINGSSCWVFPLGQDYSYTNVTFSATQDLVADATYDTRLNLL